MFRRILTVIIGQRNIEKLYSFVTSLRIKFFGRKAIEVFDQIVTEQQKTYWLAFGTLLGAYRDGGFIKNDDDIDVSMFCDEITPSLLDSLIQKGFDLEHCILTGDKQYCQLSFNYHSIPFDIYGFKKNESDQRIITGFIPRALHGKDWEESFQKNQFKILYVTMPFGGTKQVEFAGTKARIPEETELFLRKHYGDDFMTPIKGKKGSSRETIKEIPIEEQVASIVPVETIFKVFN